MKYILTFSQYQKLHDLIFDANGQCQDYIWGINSPNGFAGSIEITIAPDQHKTFKDLAAEIGVILTRIRDF